MFVADSMEDAICNQVNLLTSRVVRGVPQVDNQAFVNYRPSFVYHFVNGWVVTRITRCEFMNAPCAIRMASDAT